MRLMLRVETHESLLLGYFYHMGKAKAKKVDD